MAVRRKRLKKHLIEDTYVRVMNNDKQGRPLLHGVGVVATRNIPANTDPFRQNCLPNGVSFDFSREEVLRFPEHVQEMIFDFITPTKGVYAVPESGLNAFTVAWFMNTSNESDDVRPNVGLGNRHDIQGFTQALTTEEIPCGSELILPYPLSHAGKSKGQPIKTSDGSIEVISNYAQGDGLDECRICGLSLEVPEGEYRAFDSEHPCNGGAAEDVIDIGCSCSSRKMHSEGATRWFGQSLSIVLKQKHGENDDSQKVMNCWNPSILVSCEMCKMPLSTQLCQDILDYSAKGNECMRVIKKNIANGNPSCSVLPKFRRSSFELGTLTENQQEKGKKGVELEFLEPTRTLHSRSLYPWVEGFLLL